MRPSLILGLLIALVHGVHLGAPLFYDDLDLIQRNSIVTGPWPGARFLLSHTFADQKEYEPLVLFVHWTINALTPQAWPFRLSSLLLHWINALLILKLYRRLLGDERLALLAAALFSFYPAHGEIMAVATFKKHLLVSGFALGILHLQAGAGRLFPRLAGAMLLQTLALLSKESGLVIPILAGLAATVVPATASGGKPPRRELLKFQAGLWAVAAVFILFRIFVIPRRYPPPLSGDWIGHALTSAKCLLWYFSQLAIPWDLCLEHTLRPITGLSDPQAWPIMGGLAALAAVFIWLWKADRVAALGLAWSLVCLLPFINLLPFLNFSLVANRYLYLSSAGFFLMAARLLQRLPARNPERRPASRTIGLAASPLIVAYGLMDLSAASLFADQLALWESTARCAPANPRSHTGLGLALSSQKLWTRAEAAFLKAVALSPNFPMPRLGLAEIYARTGRLKEAISLTKAQLTRQNAAFISANLGNYHLQAGSPREALDYYLAALGREPENVGFHLQLGICLIKLKRLDDAESELILAAQDPAARSAAFKFLSEVYTQKKSPAMALTLLEKSFELDGRQADVAHALARLYVKAKRRDRARAVLDALTQRLESSLAAARAAGREEDREIIKEAQRQYLAVKRARARIL